MSARRLLEELRGHGVELKVDGDQLRYRPKEAVTPQLQDQIKRHKPKLVKLLEQERCKLDEAGHYPPDLPEARKLKAAGWKPKERCGKVIWARTETGFWYSEEVALHLLELDEGLPGGDTP
jgi:hypothetical protein